MTQPLNTFVPNLTGIIGYFNPDTIVPELQKELPELIDEKEMKVSVSENHQCFTEATSQIGVAGDIENALNFDLNDAPCKIAHNFHPNSCYIAILLNTVCDENFAHLFTPPEAEIKPQLSDEYKQEIGQIIRRLQNQSDKVQINCGILEKDENEISFSSEIEQSIYICLSDYNKAILTTSEEKEIKKLNPNLAKHLLKLIKDEIKKDIQKVIWPCIQKIKQGSDTQNKEVVDVKEISAIQDVLRHYNFIERDHLTNEDPMQVLWLILDYITTDFSLITEEEIHHYHLDKQYVEVDALPSNPTLVDETGKGSPKIQGATVISLDSTSEVVDLAKSLEQYQIDNSITDATVYRKLDENTYAKYLVTHGKVTRTFSHVTSTLILGIKELGKKAVFQEYLSLRTQNGNEHYYMLKQVNCHSGGFDVGHEYAYLKHKNKQWFLSDDLQPIRKADLKPSSKDNHDISKNGRTFIYTKIPKGVFDEAIKQNMPPVQPNSPKGKEAEKNFEPNEKVIEQLLALQKVCDKFSNPHADLQRCLLELSWGCASLPGKKKFSSEWSKVISESSWVLLEDISRQVAGQEMSFFLSKDSLNELATAFASLMEVENGKKLSTNSAPFNEIEKTFRPALDTFILEQASRYITILSNKTTGQDLNKWLKDDSHIKALFRCIEVVGEAAKILSVEKKRQIPSLIVGGEQNLYWKKLRNELHHNKGRCWDIARYAPELWIDIITFWLPRLNQDIHSLGSMQGSNAQEENLRLKTLCDLCQQTQFENLRRFCLQIDKQFEQSPISLFRYLLGVDVEQTKNYESVWEKDVVPFLKKESCNSQELKNSIIQALQAVGKIFILESDVECLASPDLIVIPNKEAAIQELSKLLKSVQPSTTKEENQKIEASFEQLANQFVFLRMDEKTVVRDVKQSKALEKLISNQRKPLSSFSLDEESFEEKYGAAFRLHISLKRKNIEESIQTLKSHLNALQKEWDKDFINLQTETIKYRGLILKAWGALKCELEFINMKNNEKQLEADFKVVQDVPIYQLRMKKIIEAEFKEKKSACDNVCISILQALEAADYGQIENIYMVKKKRLIELSEKLPGDAKKEVGEIFISLGCIDNKSLTEKLKCEINSEGLDSLKKHFNDWLNPVETALNPLVLEAELLRLTASAEDQLSISYVQTALREHNLPVDRKGNHWDKLEAHITLLKTIYLSGPHQKDAWEKIENANKARSTLISLPQGILSNLSEKKNSFEYLKTKIDRLGSLVSRILESEKKGEETEFMLLSAEYDLQEINELFQAKISKSPILSSQHALKINLIRRLTAHYPLSVDPSVLRWNLEFLAFDTKHYLSSSLPESVYLLPSKPISRQLLGDKLFNILDYLDLLHLDTDIHVLYPWVDSPLNTPFGAFTVLVRPSSSVQSKIEFLYHVMECELLLSHELNAHVKVVGEWENELLNIPAEQYVPKKMIRELVENKLSIGDWIHGHAAYDLFKNQPWTKIIFHSGFEVTNVQYEMHHELAFFFSILVDNSDFSSLEFQNFFKKSDLEESILSSLTKLQETDEKAIARWVNCLFERFAPPGVIPHYPIDIPAAIGKEPLRAVIDTQGNGLKLMSEFYDHEFVEPGGEEGFLPYYQKYESVDDFEDPIGLRLDMGHPTPYSELGLEYLAKYAASVLQAHEMFTLFYLQKEFSLAPQLFCHVATVIIDDVALGEQSKPLEDIPTPIQALINEEAQKLSVVILNLVQNLENEYGLVLCQKMLKLLQYDKIIHQQAVDYYIANRLRLRGPHIRMDQNSKVAFDQIPAVYPFVRNFRDFLSRIHQQTESMEYFYKKQCLQSFELLIPEDAIRKSLLKKAIIRQSFLNPTFLNQIPNNLYENWDALFRIIVKPKLFEILQNSRNPIKISAAIAEDLSDQFKLPNLGEESMAKTGEDAILLYHPRAYFSAKQENARLKQEFDNLIKQRTFIKEWESLYHEPFKRVYRKNPIIEVREMIDWLINKNTLPNYEFDLMPAYTDYWKFVDEQPFVKTVTISSTSGLQKTFVLWVLKEGWDLEKILQDDDRKLLLAENKRSYALIKAYIPFLELESELSNLTARLITHSKRLKDLNKRKDNSQPIDEWEQNLLGKRINEAEKEVELARCEIHKIKPKILETDFFKMFQLFANYQYFIEQGTWENASELAEHAFQKLLPDEVLKHI